MRSRREFLADLARGAAGFGLLCSGVAAFGQSPYAGRTEAVTIARVFFDEDRRISCPWNIYPGGDRNLLEEFGRVMRCEVALPPNVSSYRPILGDANSFNAVVDFDRSDWFTDHPFAFMTGEGSFNFSPQEEANVKAYVEQGGFLLMDDCVFDRGGDFFYQSAFKMLEQTFGTGSVVAIPNDHEIFCNVYDFSSTGLPYIQGQPHGARGVFIDGRLAIFLSSVDLHCGWADRPHTWFPDPAVYEKAIQMGINILAYALSH